MDSPRAPQDRPAFPEDAVTWLVGASARTVVVLGSDEVADALEAAGHDLVSRTGLPEGPRSVDVVIGCGGLPDDLQAVAHVLRPGGRLALVWNDRDQRIPWARKLDRTLGHEAAGDEPAQSLVVSGLFGFVEEESWRWWEKVDAASLEAMVRDELADRSEDEREERVAAALALYADYGRGADGMQMPWVARCFRATVVEQAWQAPRSLDDARKDDDPDATVPMQKDGHRDGHAEGKPDPVVADGDGADLLLIDFR